MAFEIVGARDDWMKGNTNLVECLDREPVDMPIHAETGTGFPMQLVAAAHKEFKPCKESSGPRTNFSFRKTLRNHSCLVALEIPATFVKEHGDSFKPTVSLKANNGNVTGVGLSIKSYPRQDRVHLGGAGWRNFVLENGFKVGQELLFSLVSMSTFTVRLLENSAPPAPAIIKRRRPPVKQQHHRNLHPNFNTSSCGVINPPSLSEMGSNEKADDVSLTVGVKNDVVYGAGTLEFKDKVETILKNLRCPHFAKIIGKSNLRENRSSTLSIPVEFQKKYGAYFSKFNLLQGRSGRMMEVCFSGTSYDRFAKGWKPFHKENGIKLGDVLLFSLRAPACWLVQVVDTSHSEEATTEGELCDIDDRK